MATIDEISFKIGELEGRIESINTNIDTLRSEVHRSLSRFIKGLWVSLGLVFTGIFAWLSFLSHHVLR
jgi:hypothetical protein